MKNNKRANAYQTSGYTVNAVNKVTNSPVATAERGDDLRKKGAKRCSK